MKKLSTFNFHSFISRRNDAGFALLFTIVIVSLILALALSIADISYRQTLLSNLAKDSQVAFYQADAALECGLEYDVAENKFPREGNPVDPSDTIQCADTMLTQDPSRTDSDSNYYVYVSSGSTSTKPCYTIIFDKRDSRKKIIEGDGYNNCTLSDRQVERTLTVTY